MPITQPNPHCVCSQAGYCSRHQIEKSHYHYQCCLGVSGAVDCGLKMWIAWELGRLGATKPADPVLEPEWPCSNVNLLNPHGPRSNKPIPQTRPPMKELLEKNPSIATALNPYIGYDAASVVAKEAAKRRVSVRDVVVEKGLLPDDQIDDALDVRGMTEPGLPTSF